MRKAKNIELDFGKIPFDCSLDIVFVQFKFSWRYFCRKSSKNRRKHERKLYSTKVGSTYEDIGLVAALHASITRYSKKSLLRLNSMKCRFFFVKVGV